MKRGYYNSVIDFFNLLNNNHVQYLVLRNYENLLSPDLFLDGHGDIDLLCINSQEVVNLSGAMTNRKNDNGFIGDGTHYYIYINNKYVSLDLRHLGDDYYCESWQNEMLKHRQFYNGFFVMNQEDYFYSLIYHAILQKRVFSNEYKQRLTQMASSLNISLDSYDEKEFIHILDSFMKRNCYQYVYSKDIVVPNRFHLVNKSLIKLNYNRRWKHWLFTNKVRAIEVAVKIKHTIEGR